MRPDHGRDPVRWLDAAREHLVVVANVDDPVRVRCFHGQRAVELAVKAVLLHHGIDFPYLHALDELFALVPGDVPEQIRESETLTPYAVQEMYPDTFTDLDADHAAEAVELARAVVEWAAAIVGA